MASFRPVSEGEFRGLLAQCKGPHAAREQAFFAMAYGTGLRPNQLLRLRFSDVFRDRHVVTRIVASRANGLGTWLKGRRVVLGPSAGSAIKTWVAQASQEGLYRSWRALFLSDTNPDQAAAALHFWRHFRRAADLAGLVGKVGLPSLRVSFGLRHLRRSNFGYRKLQNALGYDCLRNARRAYCRTSRRPSAEERGGAGVHGDLTL